MAANTTPDFDFGFSLVTEDELRARERELDQSLADTVDLAKKHLNDAIETKARLQGMINMMMPLLKNLAANPEKAYIYWPNRVEKINEFIQKLNDYAKG